MEHNNEMSSSDDDDCRFVLGPHIGRKLKRPVKLQTGCDAIKKPRNDFQDIASYLENNTEFEPSTHFDGDQEETTCLVEDCRHNKSFNAEENNNTTKNGVTNQNKFETLMSNNPSTSKTNVPEPRTEFKVPNPVGPLRSQTAKRNSNNKKDQRSVPISQSKTPENENVFRTKNEDNSASNVIYISESSTSDESVSSKSTGSKTSSKKSTPSSKSTSTNSSKSKNKSSNKSTSSTKTTSTNSSKSENKSSKKSTSSSKTTSTNSSKSEKGSSNKSTPSTKSTSTNSSRSENMSSKKSTASTKSSSTNSSRSENKSSNKSTTSTKTTSTNSSKSENKSTKNSTPSTKSTSTNSSKSEKSSKKSSNSSNKDSVPSNRLKQNQKKNKKSKKPNVSSSNFDLIVFTNDDTDSESNIHRISSAMLANAVAQAEMKVMNEKLNKSVRKLTIGFVKLFTKNAEDIDILGENDDTFTASGRFEVENKLKRRNYPDGTSGLELHMTILTTIFSSVQKNGRQKNEKDSKNGRKKNEDSVNDRKKNENSKNKGKKNKTSKNNGKLNKNDNSEINKEPNKGRQATEGSKGSKINGQQNNNQKPKQDHNNGRQIYVDPNQPSTSRNYDPSCVLSVPSTSNRNNSQSNRNPVSPEIRENEMNVDSSNDDAENPAVESATLTAEDLAVPGCNNEFVKAEQRQAFKQIKSAVGEWIRQCIDNIPIKKPTEEKDIMHDKVIRALSKKLRLLYNNCYDILRNKKILIIVPVSEDPNSNNFKPIITLSANNRIHHLMINVSDAESSEDTSSDTDVATSGQSRFRNNEATNIQNDNSCDDNSSSSLCDIDSTSEENCASQNDVQDSSTSQDTCDEIQNTMKLSKTNKKVPNSVKAEDDKNVAQNVSTNEEQNSSLEKNVERPKKPNVNDDDFLGDDESSCKNEMRNVQMPLYDSDQISSISDGSRERNNSEGNYGSEEQHSYEADIDELNSSVNAEEDDNIQGVNKCKKVPYDNEEDKGMQDKNQSDSSSEDENESNDDDNDDDDDNDNNESKQENTSCESNNGLLIQNLSIQSSEVQQTASRQHENVQNGLLIQNLSIQSPEVQQTASRQHENIQNEFNIDKLLDISPQSKNNKSLLHPSQVIHGPYDTVSNNSDTSTNPHYGRRIYDLMNTLPNIHTNTTNEREQSCNDNHEISNNAIGLATRELPTYIPVTQPNEYTTQLPTTEYQNRPLFTSSENISQNYFLNPTFTAPSAIFNQVPVISRSPLSVERPSAFQPPQPHNSNNQSESRGISISDFMTQGPSLFPSLNLSSPVVYNHNAVIQHILRPQIFNYPPTNSDYLNGSSLNLPASSNNVTPTIQNILSPPQDPERITVSTQTSPQFIINRNSQQSTSETNSSAQSSNHHSETGQSGVSLHVCNNANNGAIGSYDGREWALSDSENSDSSDSDPNETATDTVESPIQAIEYQGRRRGFMQFVEDMRARQNAVHNSTMRDSHRNLWVLQQHQSETMRRHSVQRRSNTASRPSTRPTTRVRRSQRIDIPSPTSSTRLTPSIVNFPSPPARITANDMFEHINMFAQDPANLEVFDLHRPRRPRLRSVQMSSPGTRSVQSIFNEIIPSFANIPTQSEILDLRMRLAVTPPRLDILQENQNEQRNPQSPIVIDDDDDENNDNQQGTAVANNYSASMQNLNSRRSFYANVERNHPATRYSRSELFFHTIGRIARLVNGDEELDDDENSAANAMPLQELVDNTTVVFQYDESTQEERCNICLCDYVQDDILRRLPCFHAYHRNCIDQWLSRERRTCPNCRMYLSSHLSFANTNTDT